MVHHPAVYADLLKRKMLKYNATCWLVNTGWVGGPYGVGQRISIKYTRAILSAALSGKLQSVKFWTDPVFGFQVPETCEDIPPGILSPSVSWPDKNVYMHKYKQLASRFIENFKKFEAGVLPEVIKAGPKL